MMCAYFYPGGVCAAGVGRCPVFCSSCCFFISGLAPVAAELLHIERFGLTIFIASHDCRHAGSNRLVERNETGELRLKSRTHMMPPFVFRSPMSSGVASISAVQPRHGTACKQVAAP